jgi:pyridoxal 5'-phosphate synthase pdxS subunit
MMALGSDGVFVGSGIFKSSNPEKTAAAIVQAVTHWQDPLHLADLSENLGAAMAGIELGTLGQDQRLAKRGW